MGNSSVIIAVLTGGVAVAIIEGIWEALKWRRTRKAQKEDKAEEKADKTAEIKKTVSELRESEERKVKEINLRLEEIERQSTAQSQALKLILLDRILYLGQGYIDKREISYDDRRRFHAMHECYHTGLGGNGDADLIVEAVDELPLKR